MASISSEIWDQALETLREEIDEESYATWVEPVSFKNYADGELTLAVPSIFFRNWFISNFQDHIEKLLGRIAQREVTIFYELEKKEGEETPAEANGETETVRKSTVGSGIRQAGSRPMGLESIRFNDHYTFENFVVGESNRFAYAAAQAVADPESRAYNPLFLYGGVGLGKTHLLHAIGRRLLSVGPHFSVLYVSSETFMNAFIEGIQQKDVSHFRNCFRTVDLLLIDDVQFFAGAERTQIEFFHTFNDLFNAGKKIVISSDHSPKELTELEERLRSRFEMGLVVDIQPPDLETRVAILRKKAQDLALDLGPEIEIFIAERIKTNIRKLEGALTKLSAHQAVTREPITIASVRTLLGSFFTGEEPVTISVEKIQLVVCKFFDMGLHDLTGASRARKFAVPRQLACYLAREMTNMSFPELARKFGGRDHTSILHAHRKVQEELAKDLNKRNLLKYLTKLIKEDPISASPK